MLELSIFLNFCSLKSFFYRILAKRNTGVFIDPKSLLNQLDHFYKQFKFYGLDDIFIDQIFKQLFYYICAISLNNLMLRQELCTWKTGMRIRYNLSCLEDWIRKMKMVTSRFDSVCINKYKLNLLKNIYILERRDQSPVNTVSSGFHTITITKIRRR